MNVIQMSAVIGKGKKKRSKKHENLVGPTDPKIDHQARERLVTARVGLLLRHSFFGNLATRLVLTNADEWCSTAATDGLKFYYNSRFIMLLKPKEVEFLVAHEVLHVVYDHMGRREGRHPKIFNWAADYCVNGQIVRDKIGDHNIPDIKIFHDQKYYGMSAEEIYDKIYDKYDEQELQQLGQLLDEHIDWEKEGEGRPKYTKEELKQIRDEIREATIQAANAAGAGNVGIGNSAYAAGGTPAGGSYNTAVGMQALYANTTANNNTAVGYQAGYTNTVSVNNTYIGYQAGNVLTGSSADYNTFVGARSGLAQTAGTRNTYVGEAAGVFKIGRAHV